MKNKINVLLTGASGGVGKEVLKQFCDAKKYNVTVFDIKTPQSIKVFAPYKSEIEIIYGNIALKQDVESASKNKDVVIHLAAIIPPLADDKPELAHKVNVGGTENIIQSLESFSPNAFLLYSSSISVYGDRVKNPYITISDPLIPSEGDEYAHTKIAAENLIRASQLQWSIFRLCAIMGKHKVSKLMSHQPLNTSFEIATLPDTARAFVLAIENQKELSGKTFNLGGGESCRIMYDDFLERSFSIAGLGKLDFAPKSFAEKNFHCGFYADGDELENILHFREDSMETFFDDQKENTSFIQKAFTTIFRRPIKYFLQKKSEPLQAYNTNDQKEIKRYFLD